MGLAPSGCPCFAGIARSCEVPVPIFSQPLRKTHQFRWPGCEDLPINRIGSIVSTRTGFFVAGGPAR